MSLHGNQTVRRDERTLLLGGEGGVEVHLQLAAGGVDGGGPVRVRLGEDPVGGGGGGELVHLLLEGGDLLLRLVEGLDEALVLLVGLVELLPGGVELRPEELELPGGLLEAAAEVVDLLLEGLHLGLEGLDLGFGHAPTSRADSSTQRSKRVTESRNERSKAAEKELAGKPIGEATIKAAASKAAEEIGSHAEKPSPYENTLIEIAVSRTLRDISEGAAVG